jgi:hypothetical protein
MKAEIKELAKKRGLDIAEDSVGNIKDLAIDVISLIVEKSSNKYDDMIWSAIKGKVDEKFDELIDKIDGEVG